MTIHYELCFLDLIISYTDQGSRSQKRRKEEVRIGRVLIALSWRICTSKCEKLGINQIIAYCKQLA